jgi:hypothetical protein
MTTIAESSLGKTPLGSALEAGVNTISNNQTLTFELYERKISPIDGLAYWVNASLLQASKGNVNTVDYDTTNYNEGLAYNNTVQPLSIQVQGSLHYSTKLHQSEDRTTAYNHAIFTSLSFIQAFNTTNPQQMYICSYPHEGGILKFGFSERIPFYQQAGLWHYRGDTLYSVMFPQIIESLNDLDLATETVSNSLPIWLALDVPFKIYPSYLVPQNPLPPFIVAHIEPTQTTALAQTTFINSRSSSYQLTKDTVRLTMYGLNNNQAIDFMNYVFQYTLDTEIMGLMNMPIIQDQKLPQPEFNIISKKKEATFEVNYYQNRVQDVARQLILIAFITATPVDIPA